MSRSSAAASPPRQSSRRLVTSARRCSAIRVAAEGPRHTATF
jgi:hypothetical protein